MRIWIDLTDFLKWRGNLTGIQRIQYNISKLYIESGNDVHFFVYQEQYHNFFEVEFMPEDIVKAGIVGGDYESRANIIRRRLIKFISKVVPQSTSIKNHPSCIFSGDDVVLIMGGIWVGDFIDDLEECKRQKKFKLIHFAFDMIPSFFPGYVVDWLPDAFNSYFKKVYGISEGIIAISESTANDARKFMNLYDIKNKPEIKVVRIGEGINTGDDKAEEKPPGGITSKGFILSVSTVEGRKNHAAFFYVLKEAKQRGIELPKIVIVGRDGWLTDDIRYMMKNDLDARDRIILLNNIDDSELSWLYKNCLFTVFPSFYEGWGMPVAESLMYGKLCLSSNTSSMPEIAGDLIDYFSPYDTGQILECIVKYLNRSELKSKETQIAKKYCQTSWDSMYSNINDFVNKISKI